MEAFAESEVDLATAFYQAAADPMGRALLDFLIDHPDQRFDGAALARQLGWTRNRDVARATYELGRRATALGRKRPWHEAQMGYLMEAGQAELLRRGREVTRRG